MNPSNPRPSGVSVAKASESIDIGAGATALFPNKEGPGAADLLPHECVKDNMPETLVSSGSAVMPLHGLLDIFRVVCTPLEGLYELALAARIKTGKRQRRQRLGPVELAEGSRPNGGQLEMLLPRSPNRAPCVSALAKQVDIGLVGYHVGDSSCIVVLVLSSSYTWIRSLSKGFPLFSFRYHYA